MRHIFIIILCILTQNAISQSLATTDDGRKIVLEANNTWRYLDSPKAQIGCQLPSNFAEPKSSKEMYASLKRVGATIDDLKNYVAVDNEVSEENVKLISFSEQLGNGIYNLCVNGIKMKYRRTGSVFSRFNENLLKGEK